MVHRKDIEALQSFRWRLSERLVMGKDLYGLEEWRLDPLQVMPPLIIPEPDDVNSGLGSGLFREAGYHSSIRLSMLSLFGGLLPG